MNNFEMSQPDMAAAAAAAAAAYDGLEGKGSHGAAALDCQGQAFETVEPVHDDDIDDDDDGDDNYDDDSAVGKASNPPKDIDDFDPSSSSKLVESEEGTKDRGKTWSKPEGEDEEGKEGNEEESEDKDGDNEGEEVKKTDDLDPEKGQENGADDLEKDHADDQADTALTEGHDETGSHVNSSPGAGIFPPYICNAHCSALVRFQAN